MGDSSSDQSRSNSAGKAGPKGDRLPFEPGKRSRKAKAQAAPSGRDSGKNSGKNSGRDSDNSDPASPSSNRSPRRLNPLPERPAAKAKPRSSPPPGRVYTREEMTIPEVVSKRMVRRMALFCGIPTAIGMSSFASSYWLNVSGTLEVPNVVVLLVSLGGFGLGVIGLTYGVLSASWDEQQPGSWLGFQEFSTNTGRMIEAWRQNRANRPTQK